MDISLPKEYIAGFFDGEGSIGIYHHINKGRMTGFHLRTQLVQSKTDLSEMILTKLLDEYGGNIAVSKSSSGRLKLNWILGSNPATVFLFDILDYLILKKPQAILAINWQRQRPGVRRNKKGQIQKVDPDDVIFDHQVATLMRSLKKEKLNKNLYDSSVLSLLDEERRKDIDQVMAAQADLVESIAVFEPRLVKMAPSSGRRRGR